MSSLSLTFSADGTTMFAADDDGIWQFKTVADLASSTSGSITGLNDLRTLGVPYDGQGSAVAVIDTGVDAFSAPFRGRVATGTNVYIGGTGDDDTAPATTGGGLAATGGAGAGAGGGTGTAANTIRSPRSTATAPPSRGSSPSSCRKRPSSRSTSSRRSSSRSRPGPPPAPVPPG